MDILQIEAFRLELSAQWLWHGEDEVRLTAKAFAVLRYLVENRQRLVSRYDARQGLEFAHRSDTNASVASLSRGALALWALGYPDTALRMTDSACDQAQQTHIYH